MKPPSTTIYVGNLSPGFSKAKLEELFAQYGKVTWSKTMGASTIGNKGTLACHLEMSPSESTRAIEQLNGVDFEGRALQVWEKVSREPKRKN